MRRIAVVLLVATAAWSMDVEAIGADYYVDDATGNDSRTAVQATEPATPWKTIQQALKAPGSGGMTAGTNTLYVKRGIYGGTMLSFSARPDNDVLTIQGYKTDKTDGADTDLRDERPIIATTDASSVFTRLNSPWNSGKLTLRNLKFAPPNLAGGSNLFNYGTVVDNAPNADLEFQFCQFSIPAGTTGGLLSLQTVPGVASTRAVTIRDCQIIGHANIGTLFTIREVGTLTISHVTVDGGAADFVYLGSANSIDVQDCDVGTISKDFIEVPVPDTSGLTSVAIRNNTGTSSGGRFFRHAASTLNVAQCAVEGNTFSCNGSGLSLGPAYTDVTISGSFRNVVVQNNRFTRIGWNEGHPLMLGLNVEGAEVSGNTFTGVASLDFGAVIKGSGIYFHHNYCWGRYAVYLCSGRYNHIAHNTAYGTEGYAFAWSANANPGSAGACGIDNATTDGSTGAVTIGSATDLSKVRVGDTLYLPDQTKGLDGTGYFTITAVDDGADIITVSGTPAAASNKSWYAYSPSPYDAVVIDNIFVAGTGGKEQPYAAAGAAAHMHGRIRMDYNIYVAGSRGIITGYAGKSQSTLAEARAEWGKPGGRWADASKYNDAHSLAVDPLLVDAVGGTDFSLSALSPAIGAASDGTTIGCWQPKPGGRLPWPPTDPSPADGAVDQLLTTDLAWGNGPGAVSYDVYLGTNPKPGPAEFRGNQSSPSYSLPDLQPYTTYYWRIDAVNDTGVTPGPVWRLQTRAYRADFDGDGDVDAEDFAHLQVCLSRNAPQLRPECRDTLLNDGDDRVDAIDLGIFLDCHSGPGIRAQVRCTGSK